MKKLAFYLLVIFACNHVFAQLPYLNASTGNAGEFPVDKDTCIYMYHGNRLVKTDKNFNVLWAKTYSNINYTSMLLSKTGSIFFTSDSKIGKINSSNGNLDWCKELSGVAIGTVNVNANFNRILLDRNNNLMISAYTSEGGIFLKTDTNGTFIKLKSLPKRYSNYFTILYDSAGIYKFLDGGDLCICPPNSIYLTSYNDLTNQIINYKEIFNHSSNTTIGWNLLKSKFNNCFYIPLSYLGPANSSFPGVCGIAKFNTFGNKLWQTNFSGFNGLPANLGFGNSIIENNNGLLFYSLTTGGYFQYTSGAIFRMDSLGVASSTGMVTYSINTQYSFPNFPLKKYSLQSKFGNQLYHDFVTTDVNDNPLLVNQFQSAVQSSCAITATAFVNTSAGIINNNSTNTLISVPSITVFTYSNYNSTVNNVSFSLNFNNCTLLNTNEKTIYSNVFKIQPNPASNILKFDLANSSEIDEAHVLDVNGKVIKTYLNCKEISVSDLVPGIYFLQLKSDGQTHYTKFIKE